MRVVVAVPAYNEAEGIAEFLTELDEVLAARVEGHGFVVVDDCSTDATAAVLDSLVGELAGELSVEKMTRNRGHGPTVLHAYRRAIEAGPDIVCQVDGDGQFECDDLALLLAAVEGGAAVATGRRQVRADPWFRRLLSRMLRVLLRAGFGVDRADANCPFRCYLRGSLEGFLVEVPEDSSIPHVLLTVLEERSDEPTSEVDVRHRLRRGADATGSTWRSGRVPLRLIRFCWHALGELVRFRRELGRS